MAKIFLFPAAPFSKLTYSKLNTASLESSKKVLYEKYNSIIKIILNMYETSKRLLFEANNNKQKTKIPITIFIQVKNFTTTSI